MKMPKLKTQSGLTILMTLFLVILLLIFVGSVLHVIIRAADKIKPRQLPEDEEAMRQQIVNEETAALQSANPGAEVNVGMVSVQRVFTPAINASEPSTFRVRVERSTNLVDWELLGEVAANETLMDTNAPPDRAFYRRVPIP